MSKSQLALSKHISALAVTQTKFTKAVEELKEFKTDSLRELDLEITAKHGELDMLQLTLKNAEIDGKTVCDQRVAKHARDTAVEILKKTKEVPVPQERLAELDAEVKTLKRKRDEDLVSQEKDMEAKHKRATAAIISNQELKAKAELATLMAQVEQGKSQIKVYEASVSSMRDDIAAQRLLTQQVAEAGRQGSISQSFTK
jgi:hypothetical protein